MRIVKNFLYLIGLVIFLNFADQASAAVANVNNSDGFAHLSELNKVFVNVTSIVSTLAGFVLFIMLIRGGISYIAAQGDPKAIATARSTITWAIVGIIVILAAFIIISLIAGFVNIPFLGRFCVPRGGGIDYNCPS